MFIKLCKYCGEPFSTQKISKRKYCSDKCRYLNRIKSRVVPTAICPICGVTFENPKNKKKYCSVSCNHIAARTDPSRVRKSRIAMSAVNAKFKDKIKQRMTQNNPMSDPVTISKMKTTKQINGTLHIWKGTRGGNGQYTPAQQLLAATLGWKMEIPIKLAPHCNKGEKRTYCAKHNLPTCYKVDIGNSTLKIAIEVDGDGHQLKEKKWQDTKKTQILTLLGWKVLRFTNKEITTNLSKVLLEIKKIIVAS